MTDPVPGPAERNNERILRRGYESEFARFPPAEIESSSRPGAGPRGALDDGINIPLAVSAAGFALVFANFAVQVVWLLAAGVLMMVAGMAWSAARGRGGGSGRGLGPVRPRQRRRSPRA